MIMDDGRYKQIGITSFGLVFGCELGLHAAFTRTSKSKPFNVITLGPEYLDHINQSTTLTDIFHLVIPCIKIVTRYPEESLQLTIKLIKFYIK
jgi:hypothetical protein